MSQDFLGNEQFYECFEDADQKKQCNNNSSTIINDITNELENKAKIQNQNLNSQYQKETKDNSKIISNEESQNQQLQQNEDEKQEKQINCNEQNKENDILYKGVNDQQKEQEEFEQKIQEQQYEETQKVEKSLEKALEFKEAGNKAFKFSNTNQALMDYEKAEEYCPEEETKTLAIIYSNMAICYKQHKDLESTILYATKAIELNSEFPKPYVTRVDVYEKQEKLEECLEDYKQLAKFYPQHPEYKYKVLTIGKKVEELQKKKMDEVVTGLKDIGNKVLGYFGLSTDNFKLQQNENGSYNIQFQQ